MIINQIMFLSNIAFYFLKCMRSSQINLSCKHLQKSDVICNHLGAGVEPQVEQSIQCIVFTVVLVRFWSTQSTVIWERGTSMEKKKCPTRWACEEDCKSFACSMTEAEGPSPLCMVPPMGRGSCVIKPSEQVMRSNPSSSVPPLL